MLKTNLERRPRNSEATRDRILKAARQAFATQGYDRATIRGIAEMADIHPSMVMRYFTSKEGVFTASTEFDLQLPDLSRVPRGKAGETLVRLFLERWESTQMAGDLPALLRLSVTHPEGRERVIAVFREQVEPSIRKIASGNPSLSAALIATQLVGLAFLRYVIHLPSVVEIERDDLVRHVGRTVQQYLEGD
jgi:AcrR family transcriptional regulator